MEKSKRKRMMRAILLIGVLFFSAMIFQMETRAATPVYQMKQSTKTMIIGSTSRFQVPAKGGTVTWSSTKQTVATVTKNGLVTAKKKGTTTIKARVRTSGKTTVYKCKVKVVTQQTAYASATIKKINKQRRKYGYPSLDQNYYLMQAAQKRAKEIGDIKFSKYRPNGTSFASAISMEYDFLYAAQSIACDFVSPQEVVDAWMANASSKANIISRRYEDIGVGVYVAEDGYMYWVVIYGRRK